MKTVKEIFTPILEKEGYKPSEDGIIEYIIEFGEEVWTGDTDEHRWYILEETVHDVDGIFVKFDKYIITGDKSMDDMDLSYDLNDFSIVERKEKVETVVYYE